MLLKHLCTVQLGIQSKMLQIPHHAVKHKQTAIRTEDIKQNTADTPHPVAKFQRRLRFCWKTSFIYVSLHQKLHAISCVMSDNNSRTTPQRKHRPCSNMWKCTFSPTLISDNKPANFTADVRGKRCIPLIFKRDGEITTDTTRRLAQTLCYSSPNTV